MIRNHAAIAGSEISAVDALHRIDVAAVKAEVEAAGFKLDSESPSLRDAADAHTINVFDRAIRGKTDQFILKVRKPG